MRFSLAIILAVVASSISATPIDANAQDCPAFCWINNNCKDCTWGLCVSISRSPGFDNMAHLHGRNFLSAQ
jgi:hypothetical protein